MDALNPLRYCDDFAPSLFFRHLQPCLRFEDVAPDTDFAPESFPAAGGGSRSICTLLRFTSIETLPVPTVSSARQKGAAMLTAMDSAITTASPLRAHLVKYVDIRKIFVRRASEGLFFFRFRLVLPRFI